MKSEKNTTIIFQEGRLSKILKVNRKTFKQFFTTLSLLISALVISMLLTILFYQSRISTVKLSQSSEIESLQNQTDQQSITIENLTNENTTLREKLAQPAESHEGTGLSLFSQSKGFKDLSKKKTANLEDAKAEYINGTASLKFNLINTVQSEKISGFAFILLYSDTGVLVQPKSTTFKDGLPLEFHQGESFTASRFRPFEAKFKVDKNIKDVSYRVVIFSKTGDLITNETIGPFDLKNLSL